MCTAVTDGLEFRGSVTTHVVDTYWIFRIKNTGGSQDTRLNR